MKSQVRLLPHLNQLYLQKKSYEIHRKKIDTIKRSSSFSKKSIDCSRINDINDNQQDIKGQLSKNIKELKVGQVLTSSDMNGQFSPSTHMQTIQQAKPNLLYWMRKMTPLQRRIKQGQIKQNKRIKQKIKKTTSFITTKNELQIHNYHFEGMKRRLQKFSSDQISNRTALKCQLALRKISELQKSKLKTTQSRIRSLDRFVRQPSQKKQNNLMQIKQSVPMTKRSKISSFKISVKGNQNSRVVNESKTLMKIRSNVSLQVRSQLVQQKTRHSLISSYNSVKMPGLRISPKYQNIKTDSSQNLTSNRLFNNSKLSQLSNSTNLPHKNLSQYKMVRVNRTQPSERGFRKISTVKNECSQYLNKIDKFRGQSDLKHTVRNRIQTQGAQNRNLQRNASLKTNLSSIQKPHRYDYQRKRIQRFVTSDNPFTMKNVVNPSNSMIKLNTQTGIKLQDKTEQKIDVQTAVNQQQIKKNIENLSNYLQQNIPSCFATQIQ